MPAERFDFASTQGQRLAALLDNPAGQPRAYALFADGTDSSLVRRLAGAAFLIRVVSAALTFVSQILLARWMGGFEFGIYVYAMTWVLLLGPALDLGLGTAAQRFIPEYRDRKNLDMLRGFIAGSRMLAFASAVVIAAVCAGLVWGLSGWLDDYLVVPLYLICIMLPAYALSNAQDGISRSYDWVGLALIPTYIIRQVALTSPRGHR